MFNEKVFFVKLAEDISGSGNEQFVVETEKPKPKEFLQIEAKDSHTFDIQVSASAQTSVSGENNDDLNLQEKPADNILLSGDEKGAEGTLRISSTQERDVGSRGLFPLTGNPKNSDKKDNSFSFGSGGTSPHNIIETIRNSIERVKTYPILARKRGIEGTVHISFRISPQGEPQTLKILKSSGSSILDTATLEIVKKAAPFPHVDNLIEVPVVFKLKD